MILAIITFAYEAILLVILAILGETNNTSSSFAWFSIISLMICSFISVLLLIYNIYHIKNDDSKTKPIIGTIFSGISLFIGLVVVIIFFIMLGIINSIGK